MVLCSDRPGASVIVSDGDCSARRRFEYHVRLAESVIEVLQSAMVFSGGSSLSGYLLAALAALLTTPPLPLRNPRYSTFGTATSRTW
jgi:hypothetical protein